MRMNSAMILRYFFFTKRNWKCPTFYENLNWKINTVIIWRVFKFIWMKLENAKHKFNFFEFKVKNEEEICNDLWWWELLRAILRDSDGSNNPHHDTLTFLCKEMHSFLSYTIFTLEMLNMFVKSTPQQSTQKQTAA